MTILLTLYFLLFLFLHNINGDFLTLFKDIHNWTREIYGFKTWLTGSKTNKHSNQLDSTYAYVKIKMGLLVRDFKQQFSMFKYGKL